MNMISSMLLAIETGTQIDSALNGVETVIYTIVIPVLFWGVGLFCVIKAVLIGIDIMQSKTPEERQQSKSKLVWFLIGFAICFMLAFAVPLIAQYLAGVFPRPTAG